MSAVAINEENVVSPEAVKLAECSPEQRTWGRYCDALDALIDDAHEHESTQILADALTFALAVIIAGSSTPYVVGDVLRILGDHICDLTACDECEAEAERKEREEG